MTTKKFHYPDTFGICRLFPASAKFMQKIKGSCLISGVFLLGIMSLAGCEQNLFSNKKIPLTTPYQAVRLDNGQIYFGKLDQTQAGYLLLTDAYFVSSGVDQNTKQVSSTLVRMNKQMYGPDRIYLNPQHVVAIETVAENSQIAQGIKNIQQQEKKP